MTNNLPAQTTTTTTRPMNTLVEACAGTVECVATVATSEVPLVTAASTTTGLQEAATSVEVAITNRTSTTKEKSPR